MWYIHSKYMGFSVTKLHNYKDKQIAKVANTHNKWQNTKEKKRKYNGLDYQCKNS